jgi:signal transduction histidine kinase
VARGANARRHPRRPVRQAQTRADLDAIARLLGSLPPFYGMPSTTLTRIASDLRSRQVAEGQVLVRQGDPAEEFCVLAEGRVVISVDDADPDAPPVGFLEAPTWFGEIGILTGGRRTATLTALTPCVIWVLPRTRFEAFLLRHPRVSRNLLALAARRIHEKDQDFLGQSGLAAERGRLLQENARLVAEVRAQAEQLETASRHKSEFLARMSHELRTPLNAIIGFSEILLADETTVTPAERREFVDNIASAGKHLLRLISDILDLSKVEAGKMELDTAPVPLADTVMGVLDTVRPLAMVAGVQLAADLPPDLPLVLADARRLAQILYNLLSNAIKFTPPRGSVHATARWFGPEAGPGRRREAGWVEVAVSDTGVGIAAEDQAKIFEEFEQTQSTRSRPGGTGLGLSLVKRLVALHGGDVRVVSQPGRGSTFSFTLPAAP